MLDSSFILQLFGNILNEDIARYEIDQKDIRRAVQNMAHVYAPQPGNLQLTTVNVINYNDAAHRCAYLHKYAAFHTAMVQDTMFLILEQRWKLFKTIISSEEFRICSLGGGPGNDAIGVTAALNTLFCIFKVHITVVDLMEQWKVTFSSVIAELSYGNYGTLRTNAGENFLQWNYIGANLLEKIADPVKTKISQASLITLVKFVSATACQGTEKMIKRIFRLMKPGALLLYIDNAGGGFRHLINNAANKYKCETVFGPLNHIEYCNEALKNERFGYTSCFTTTVTVHLLQKPTTEYRRQLHYNMTVSRDVENNISSDATCIRKPASKKRNNAHPNSSLSDNYYALYQNIYLPGSVNHDANLFPSYQQNANTFCDKTLTAKPISSKKTNVSSNVSASHNNARLHQSTKLPAGVNKDCISVSSDQKNIDIATAAPLSQKPDSKGINSQMNSISHKTSNSSLSDNYNGLYQNAYMPGSVTNNATPVPYYQQNANTLYDLMLTAKPISAKKTNASSNVSASHNSSLKPDCKEMNSETSSTSHDTPLFPDDASVNFPLCADAPSTSLTVGNFNSSVNFPQNGSVNTNNLPVKHPKTILTSFNPGLQYNTFLSESNSYPAPRRSNNSYTALPTNSNRINSAVPPQSQSNAFAEPEDNLDTCCSCCVIS